MLMITREFQKAARVIGMTLVDIDFAVGDGFKRFGFTWCVGISGKTD